MGKKTASIAVICGVENTASDSREEAATDAATAVKTEAAAEESEPLWTEPIPGLREDFIFGMDASSVLVEENSGVTYYNFDGQEQDVFQTFAEAGVNYIRLRVWNDPYDENGNGYGGLGIFYWEGAWISVGDAKADNTPIWEQYGSGWASSFASDYDPEQAGKYYGGCSWDNQAFFDFEGHPLASINVFQYMKHGN